MKTHAVPQVFFALAQLPRLCDRSPAALGVFGMALQALARMVAQRLESEVAAYRDARKMLLARGATKRQATLQPLAEASAA
jgi:hypothetical protein